MDKDNKFRWEKRTTCSGRKEGLGRWKRKKSARSSTGREEEERSHQATHMHTSTVYTYVFLRSFISIGLVTLSVLNRAPTLFQSVLFVGKE